MAFESHDSRTYFSRLLFILGGALVAAGSYYGLTIPSFGWPEKAIALGIAAFLCYPLFAAGAPRHLSVHLLANSVELIYNRRAVATLPYSDIEYAGYTAEIMGNSGLRYVPVASGYLYITTQPGFLCTIDLRRPRSVAVAWMVKAPVRRVLFTLDDPYGFMSELRLHVLSKPF